MLSLQLSFLLFSVSAQNLLLVPKPQNTFKLESFSVEHNLETVASFDDFSIYSTTIENFNSFSNTLTELFDIEEDQIINLQEQTQKQFRLNPELVPWHLNRIIKRKSSESISWNGNVGSCHTNPNVSVHTYIIDTGIDINHPEFEGRAEWLANFAGDNEDFDGNSHGTFCAGLVASKSYGSCRDAKLFAVKVLDASGSGTLSGVIKGVEFAYKRHTQLSKTSQGIRSVVSMSLGGGYSQALNMAVESCLRNSNTFYIAVAAGNENRIACKTSPASAKGVITVMAMGNDDTRAYFSNFGKCADIYSPGVDILSTIPNGTAVYSGTSMSTPILVGIINHYLHQFENVNMEQLKEKILNDSTKDIIDGNPENTPNKLVYLELSSF